MKVYNAIYTQIEAEGFQHPYVRVKSFDSEVKAEEWLRKDYEATLEGLEDGDTVLDVISSDNYGNNAEILVGEKDEENDDNSIVEVKHTWRVYTNTINYED